MTQAKRRATHNAVERRRRDRINQHIQQLSKLIPDCSNYVKNQVRTCNDEQHVVNIFFRRVKQQSWKKPLLMFMNFARKISHWWNKLSMQGLSFMKTMFFEIEFVDQSECSPTHSFLPFRLDSSNRTRKWSIKIPLNQTKSFGQQWLIIIDNNYMKRYVVDPMHATVRYICNCTDCSSFCFSIHFLTYFLFIYFISL